MKPSCLLLLAAVLLLPLASCTTLPPTAPPVAAELTDKRFLYEVARHLYRWYLDEQDLRSVPARTRFEFLIRERHPVLDAGDQSRYAEIVMPALGLVVSVKRPDYPIAELGLVVTSSCFKVVQVSREVLSAEKLHSYARVEVEARELEDYLFRTRAQSEFPDARLRGVMHQAALRTMLKEEHTAAMLTSTNRQATLFLAPLSPVANETWVFWEEGRLLVRFASDLDLSHTAVWRHEDLTARVYDLDRHVVVSHEESPGSNAFLTRDQVGRVLYNCVVRGMRLVAPRVEPDSVMDSR